MITLYEKYKHNHENRYRIYIRGKNSGGNPMEPMPE